MVKETEFYYFSPTGGTKKTGEILCRGLSEKIYYNDLMKKTAEESPCCSDLAVIAAPVFGGRIPSIAAERIKTLKGSGRKAVTLAVYGNRAYEDGLLELNQAAEAAGFEIIASGAFIARHSMAPEVAKGRPDNKDEQELLLFAEKILSKLERNDNSKVVVPGNQPYKSPMTVSVTPISLPDCVLCKTCVSACPAEAITIEYHSLKTDLSKCILCVRCTAVCPKHARVLPEPFRKATQQKLEKLVSVRTENETFL